MPAKIVLSCLFGLLLFHAAPARAQNVVRVSKSFGAAMNLDASAFGSDAEAPAKALASTILSDLRRSGWFNIVSGGGEVTLQGKAAVDGGQVVVACRVVRTAGNVEELNRTYRAPAEDVARLAHRAADEIVFAVTGRKGIASTRIALVGARGGAKELFMCDADGRNLVQLTRDNSVSMKPRWDPDGRRIVYTSYRSGFPSVYLIDLESSRRERISKFPGLNSAAEFTPDGRQLVLTLSKDGNPELYSMNLSGGGLARLTETVRSAETSPSLSPDGSQIVFVSDSPGSPQLYIMDRRGGQRSRVTLTGSENVAPDWGPDGLIVYCSRRFGRYQLCMLDPKTKEEQLLTQEDVDHEDPSWAPDGRHIVYTRTEGYKRSVYILDRASKASIALLAGKDPWYMPSWSP